MWEQVQTWVQQPVVRYHLFGVASTIFAAFVVLFLKKRLWSRLAARAHARGGDPWVEDILRKTENPVRWLLIVTALSLGFHTSSFLTHEYPWITPAIKVGFVSGTLWLIDRIVWISLQRAKLPPAFTSSMRTLILSVWRIGFFALGGLILLDTLGISITPLLASLGVGSVAVALALQDTLGNFFSGLYLLLDRPIRVGDFVKVDGASEGEVVRIGWRSTQIRLGTNNTMVIPNSKLSTSILTNYDFPQPETTVPVELGVAYGSDLEHVERVTIEVATEILKRVPGAVPEFAPNVRFHTFADSSINFSVTLRARHFPDSGVIKHEFIKALHKRYGREGIDIPFPQRVVYQAKA